MDGSPDVGSREDGEHERLDEGHEALQRVDEHQQQEPQDRHATGEDIHGSAEQTHLDEAGSGDGKDGKHHVAGEHVAVESDGEREHADDRGEQLQEPDDGLHRAADARRSEAGHVAAQAVGLDAVDDEVDERDDGERPGAGDGAGSRLEAGDETQEIADQDEEEQRGQEGHVLLESVADDVFGNILVHEVIAVLHHVDELVGGNQLDLLGGNQDYGKRDDQRDEQPDDVLGDVPAADAEHRLRVEMSRDALCLFDERIESFAHEFPSLDDYSLFDALALRKHVLVQHVCDGAAQEHDAFGDDEGHQRITRQHCARNEARYENDHGDADADQAVQADGQSVGGSRTAR